MPSVGSYNNTVTTDLLSTASNAVQGFASIMANAQNQQNIRDGYAADNIMEKWNNDFLDKQKQTANYGGDWAEDYRVDRDKQIATMAEQFKDPSYYPKWSGAAKYQYEQKVPQIRQTQLLGGIQENKNIVGGVQNGLIAAASTGDPVQIASAQKAYNDVVSPITTTIPNIGPVTSFGPVYMGAYKDQDGRTNGVGAAYDHQITLNKVAAAYAQTRLDKVIGEDPGDNLEAVNQQLAATTALRLSLPAELSNLGIPAGPGGPTNLTALDVGIRTAQAQVSGTVRRLVGEKYGLLGEQAASTDQLAYHANPYTPATTPALDKMINDPDTPIATKTRLIAARTSILDQSAQMQRAGGEKELREQALLLKQQKATAIYRGKILSDKVSALGFSGQTWADAEPQIDKYLADTSYAAALTSDGTLVSKQDLKASFTTGNGVFMSGANKNSPGGIIANTVSDAMKAAGYKATDPEFAATLIKGVETVAGGMTAGVSPYLDKFGHPDIPKVTELFKRMADEDKNETIKQLVAHTNGFLGKTSTITHIPTQQDMADLVDSLHKGLGLTPSNKNLISIDPTSRQSTNDAYGNNYLIGGIQDAFKSSHGEPVDMRFNIADKYGLPQFKDSRGNWWEPYKDPKGNLNFQAPATSGGNR